MEGPKVSIIIPVYDAEETLLGTLRSVVAQTETSWEALLVVDGKSTDQSLAIASAHAQVDPRFSVITGSHCQGVARNRNAGLEAARGEWIAFLDADDIWIPAKLETQLAFAAVQSEAWLTCHSFQPIGEDDQVLGPKRTVPAVMQKADLLKNNRIGCSTVMVRRELIGSCRFQEGAHEDFVFWVNLLDQVRRPIFGINQVLGFYRVSRQSRSGNKLRSALNRWQIYSRIGISFWMRLYYMCWYLLTGVLKRIGSTDARS